MKHTLSKIKSHDNSASRLAGYPLFPTTHAAVFSRGPVLILILLAFAGSFFLTACQPSSAYADVPDQVQAYADGITLEPANTQPAALNPNTARGTSTPYPTRPPYQPGELVDYVAQTGDTLPALAIRFNTTVDEIRLANDFIPPDATTMPPGMPMQIPIYYLPFWGSPYQILPDSLFINGPAQQDFDPVSYVASSPGWLRDYKTFAVGKTRRGGEIVQHVADNFSVSPRLLLAILEYQLGALSSSDLPPTVDPDYPLGYTARTHRGLYMQLAWLADRLNHGYYGWRSGKITGFDLPDGTFERPDPWQNAATIALQSYFLQASQSGTNEYYRESIGPDGLAQTYQELFGDPWQSAAPHIGGSLHQPVMLLPFESGKTWAYTGGPHTGWGKGYPYAAIDFAPPSSIGGCSPSNEWNTAVADGVVARHDEGILELDLDGDGDIRTGWVILYLHIATQGKKPVGTVVQAGDPLGHPSCEGGTSTGTHIHIARKYNGEWISADGPVAFNLEGWVAQNGEGPYKGYLRQFSQVITACDCSNQGSQLTAPER